MALKDEMNTDYPVFKMDKIDEEARLLAVAWGDQYIPGIGMQEKVKLASDFMNYARRKKKLPSSDKAAVIALEIAEGVIPKLDEREQALFIAGFQECIKYLLSGKVK